MVVVSTAHSEVVPQVHLVPFAAAFAEFVASAFQVASAYQVASAFQVASDTEVAAAPL